MRLNTLALTVALLAGAFPAAAQVRSPLPRLDVGASVGWHVATEAEAQPYDRWYRASLSRGASTSWYWTEHLVTTLDVGASGVGELFTDHPDSSPSRQIWGTATYTYRTRHAAVAQRYQFGHNAWFHPYLGTGVALEWVERGGELGPLYDRTGRVVQPGRPVPDTTTRRARGFLEAGGKAYVTRRVFVRPELRVGFAGGVQHVVTTIGVGVDF